MAAATVALTQSPRMADAQADSPSHERALRRQKTLASVLDINSERLRGVPLPSLLAGAAWLFASYGAAARTHPHEVYALSKPVRRIDFFVSHSWSSSRFAKWLALTSYLNMRTALCAAFLANLAAFWYSLFMFERAPDALKMRVVSIVDSSEHEVVGLCVAPLAFVCFAITLMTAHNLSWRRECAFLDISCVPQHDEAEKADGIAALGAVLARSERMVLLTDDKYWRRLWCLFELAAFCRHAQSPFADVSRLVVLPLHNAVLALGFAVFNAFLAYGIALFSSPKYNQVSPVVGFAVAFLAQPAILLALAQARRSRAALRSLCDFSIEDAECSSSADRAALVALISEWHTDTKAGESEAQRLRALGRHKFEAFVRLDLAPSILRQTEGERPHLLSFVLGLHGLCLATISAPSISLVHGACVLVVFTFVALIMFPCLELGYELSSRCTLAVELWLVPRVAAPGSWRSMAARSAVYLLGASASACTFPLYIQMRRLCATPNLLLSTEWHPPSDGLDAESRRYLKHFLVLLWHLAAYCLLPTDQGSRRHGYVTHAHSHCMDSALYGATHRKRD